MNAIESVYALLCFHNAMAYYSIMICTLNVYSTTTYTHSDISCTYRHSNIKLTSTCITVTYNQLQGEYSFAKPYIYYGFNLVHVLGLGNISMLLSPCNNRACNISIANIFTCNISQNIAT